LWPLDRARAVVNAAAAQADIARPSIDDARQITGLDDPEANLRLLSRPRLPHRRPDARHRTGR
jgi:sugar/nucleoside kinase (ribokinase family)